MHSTFYTFQVVQPRYGTRNPYQPFLNKVTALLAVIFLLVAPAWLQAQTLRQQAVQQIQALLAEKASRTPVQQKISSQLLQGVREARGQKMVAGVNLEAVRLNRDSRGYVEVDITTTQPGAIARRITAAGGTVLYASDPYNTIRATVALALVETIAAWPEVKLIEPAAQAETVGNVGATLTKGKKMLPNQQPISVAQRQKMTPAERRNKIKRALTKYLQQEEYNPALLQSGLVKSEADVTHGADKVREKYGALGQGIKIGVLSDSYDKLGAAATDVANGELPGTGNPYGNTTPITIVEESATGSDEGRAMLQLIHDIAPKAQLFYATAFGAPSGFASNILKLRNTYSCDIIVDDVGYSDEPVFQDGIIAQAVNTVTANGCLYFSSAANSGSVAKNTAGVWEGDFNDGGTNTLIPGGTLHNFGTVAAPVTGDIILARNTYYSLHWSDPTGASSNDYDLFLVNAAGTTIKASATNVQNGTQNPYEIINAPSLVTGDRLIILKKSSAQVRALHLNANRGRLTIFTSGQTHGHSSAVAAYSVAATPAATRFSSTSSTGPYPGVFVSTNKVENFSSDGLRRIFYNADGSAITPGNVLFATNGGVVRNKPDLTAADGVSTSVTGFKPFYGTSAAAPDAAAIAALLKSAKPSLTPAQIRTALTSTALDIEGAGYDNVSGAGIIQALQAIESVNPVAKATLRLDGISIREGTYSNNNGLVEPGELMDMFVVLYNTTAVTATNAVATITTSTPGATVAQGSFTYGTIREYSSVINPNAFPFRIGVDRSSVACGTTINGVVSVAFGGGASPLGFPFSIVVGSGSPAVCAAAPACSAITVGTASISSGAAGSPYTQSFAVNGGSGFYNLSLVGDLPNGLVFSGNTLSGTPTQAGNFPIILTGKDVTGCPITSRAYTLTISGTPALNITVNAGSTPQTVVPGTATAVRLGAFVTAANNAGLSGVKVVFTAPASGASGTFANGLTTDTVITGNGGVATASIFTANSTTGTYTVTAKAVGVNYTANFNITNTCPATYVVTSSADSGPGTLREALTISCSPLNISFDNSVTAITLTSGNLVISRSVTINGRRITISGNNVSRIFYVNTAGITANLKDLTLINGKSSGTNGGGAILVNAGTVNLTGCLMMNNDAIASSNQEGGAIDNEGTGVVAIDRCTIMNNTAPTDGGGIANWGSSMTINNSTIVNNSAGAIGEGGGVYSYAILSITNSTIANNTALRGGNLFRNTNTFTFKNSIISGGSLLGTGGAGPDINGIVTSNNYNLVQNISGATINGTTTNNITGVNPQLLPIGNYFGYPVPMCPLMPTSPAINMGDIALTDADVDQREKPRRIGVGSDIGAVEMNYLISTSSGNNQSAGGLSPFTNLLKARVSDIGSNTGMPGDTVVFTAPASGASGTFPGGVLVAKVVTDANGIATAPTFNSNNTMGSYNVVASIGNAFAPVSFHMSNTSVLPVVWGSVSVTAANCTVQLQWKTLTEVNNSTFSIEYSTDNIRYSSLTTLPAKGSGATEQQYAYIHTNPAAGVGYYRIRQTDKDGHFSYSKILSVVNNCEKAVIAAYPNPVKDKLTVQLPQTVKGLIAIYDAVGRQMTRLRTSGGTQEVDTQTWAKGIYTLSVVQDGKTTYTLKLVKE